MDEIIPTTLKEFLSWKDDNSYEGKIDYIRVYTFPDKDEMLFLRHIQEHKKIRNGETKKIEYSIITKLSGRFNCSSGWHEDKSFNDYCSKLNEENLVFSFHSPESYNIESLLTLFLLKKGEKIRLELYPRNDSDFIRKELNGYHNECIYLSFMMNDKKKYSIECSHIPNCDFTKYLHMDREGYKAKELYQDCYPEKIPDNNSCQAKPQSAVIEA